MTQKLDDKQYFVTFRWLFFFYQDLVDFIYAI